MYNISKVRNTATVCDRSAGNLCCVLYQHPMGINQHFGGL